MVDFNSNIQKLNNQVDVSKLIESKEDKMKFDNDLDSIWDNMETEVEPENMIVYIHSTEQNPLLPHIKDRIEDVMPKPTTQESFGIESNQKGNGINDKTKQRNIEDKKANLSPEEQAVFEKYQDAIANMGENDDIGDVLNDLISEMSDEELLDFLSAYDYVFDEDGGMEALISSLFNNMVKDGAEDKQVEVFKRFADLLSNEDKKAVEEFFNKNMDDTENTINNRALQAFLSGHSLEGYEILQEKPDVEVGPREELFSARPKAILCDATAPTVDITPTPTITNTPFSVDVEDITPTAPATSSTDVEDIPTSPFFKGDIGEY